MKTPGRSCWAVATAGLLFTSVVALSVSRAEAQCKQWDVSGQWWADQSNQSSVMFNLRQTGTQFTGTAVSGRNANAAISVTGTIVGNEFNVTVFWGGPIGVYTGTVDTSGGLSGRTTDRASGASANWHSRRPMKCADAAPAPPAPPKVIKSSGKAKPATPSPDTAAATAPPSTGAPRISARPNVVTIPDGQSEGTVTLTWDSGPDHPYAEVWVKAGGQDETFLVEQGKGTRSVTVERGKNYLFILSDSGQQLAKVVVISKQ
jgi:hypothetical protein